MVANFEIPALFVTACFSGGVSHCLMSSVSHACTEGLATVPSPSKTLKVICTYCPLLGDITTVFCLPCCFLYWLSRSFAQRHPKGSERHGLFVIDWTRTGLECTHTVCETILDSTPV